LSSLRAINAGIRHPLKIYYDTMVDAKISRTIWMGYVQGFQGWAAGEMVDDVYVQYDGLSGNQLLFCILVDGFLGADSYLTEEQRQRSIPDTQRMLSASMRRHSFRERARAAGDEDIEAQMREITRHMKVRTII